MVILSKFSLQLLVGNEGRAVVAAVNSLYEKVDRPNDGRIKTGGFYVLMRCDGRKVSQLNSCNINFLHWTDTRLRSAPALLDFTLELCKIDRRFLISSPTLLMNSKWGKTVRRELLKKFVNRSFCNYSARKKEDHALN